MRILYNILAYLSMPWVLCRLFIRSSKMPAGRKNWWQRFGFVPEARRECVWFHAVSVGEAIAAVPLIKECQLQFPKLKIVVTTTTPTGAGRIQAALGDTVMQYYAPYDLSGAVQRFIKRMKPKLLVLIETELWPNLVHHTHKAKIPVVLVNARLSEKSAGGYAMVAGLTKTMLASVSHVAIQAKADAQRFYTLGLPRENATVTGSVKYDLEIPEQTMIDAKALRTALGAERPVWIAASTHQGEEEKILQAFKNVLRQLPNALLILVPRHPNRFNQVAELLAKEKLAYCRRSEKTVRQEVQVFLGDTMGEMLLFYAASDIAFVGGSFSNTGGHNTLEPAALSMPVLQGPNWFNFAETTALLTKADALIQVNSSGELAEKLLELFSDKDACVAMGVRAKAVVEANRGSVAKQFEIIRKYI